MNDKKKVKIIKCPPSVARGASPSKDVCNRSGGSVYYSNETEHRQGEVSMWRAVILQAVLDAKSKSRRKKFVEAKEEALKWIFEENDGFREVCLLADFDPDQVRDKIKKAKFRDFRRFDFNSEFSLKSNKSSFQPYAGNPFGQLGRKKIKILIKTKG